MLQVWRRLKAVENETPFADEFEAIAAAAALHDRRVSSGDPRVFWAGCACAAHDTAGANAVAKSSTRVREQSIGLVMLETDRAGFEPASELPHHTLSRRAP
jgi:hypothetical protein